jgi:hypothetical protein
MFPIKRAYAPQIYKGCEKHDDKNRDLCVARPSSFTNGNCPCKYKDRFKIEYDEKHCDEIELGREPHPSRTF